MDIDELFTVDEHETGAEMQVKDKLGVNTDMHIKLAGVDSKLFRKAKDEMRKKILANEDKTDPESFKVDALVSITLDWRGVTSNGKELKFDKKKLRQLYINAPYIVDQADAFTSNRVNFTKS